MIPALIIYLIRKYKQSTRENTAKARQFIKKAGRRILLIVIFAAAVAAAFSQEKKLNYEVKRNGKVIGTLSFTQKNNGAVTQLSAESDIRTRFLFSYNVKALEEAIYENGIMTWSYIYRTMNGNDKIKQKTETSGNTYVISRSGESEVLDQYPIRYSMLSFYSSEPVGIDLAYSDNFRAFVQIQRPAPGHYRIALPDGSANDYFYNNGLCTKIEIHHTWYSATIELKN